LKCGFEMGPVARMGDERGLTVVSVFEKIISGKFIEKVGHELTKHAKSLVETIESVNDNYAYLSCNALEK
jgi:hypothetical protein